MSPEDRLVVAMAAVFLPRSAAELCALLASLTEPQAQRASALALESRASRLTALEEALDVAMSGASDTHGAPETAPALAPCPHEPLRQLRERLRRESRSGVASVRRTTGAAADAGRVLVDDTPSRFR